MSSVYLRSRNTVFLDRVVVDCCGSQAKDLAAGLRVAAEAIEGTQHKENLTDKFVVGISFDDEFGYLEILLEDK